MKQGFPEVSNYKVLVECCTYNQSQYIEDALNGFAMQQTDFPFLCCVFDDASTDGEQEVLKRWIENHCNSGDIETYDHPLTIIFMAPDKNNPNCIYAVHLQKVNTWGKPEKREMMSHWERQCEYIALCEGDDYWIDPLKLQKQVDFLDKNPEYVMVYTNANVYNQSKDKQVNGTFGHNDNSYESLLKYNPIPTLTVMYKLGAMVNYHDVIKPHDRGWLLGDYPMWLWLSLQGNIKFIPEYTAVYRILEQSASHSNDYSAVKRFALSSISVKCFFISKFGVKDKEIIDDFNYHRIYNLAFAYRNYDDLKFYYKKLVKKSTKDKAKLLIGYLNYIIHS